MLLPTKHGANDVEDFVVITLGDMKPKGPYQTALAIAHHLRLACKHAARFDNVPGSFWTDVDMEDLNDCPRPHRGFRRSSQVSNFKTWDIEVNGQLVSLSFDGRGREMDYEEGIKLHQRIRRAGRRAKAWAGDTVKGTTMLANITDAAEDDRLGLAN
jgi:hypothetical protein